MHACMHVCMYACMHVCMYACMHVCMYACMHVCMYCEVALGFGTWNLLHFSISTTNPSAKAQRGFPLWLRRERLQGLTEGQSNKCLLWQKGSLGPQSYNGCEPVAWDLGMTCCGWLEWIPLPENLTCPAVCHRISVQEGSLYKEKSSAVLAALTRFAEVNVWS